LWGAVLILASAHALHVMSGMTRSSNGRVAGRVLCLQILRRAWAFGWPIMRCKSCASDGESCMLGSVRGLRVRIVGSAMSLWGAFRRSLFGGV